MDKDELLERYEALGEDDDFLAAKPLFEAEIRRREQSEAGLHGPDAALLLRQYGYLLNVTGGSRSGGPSSNTSARSTSAGTTTRSGTSG